MLRKTIKKVATRKQDETLGQYYKRVSRIEDKIKETVLSILGCLIVGGVLAWLFIAALLEPVDGYYKAVDSDSIHYEWIQEGGEDNE